MEFFLEALPALISAVTLGVVSFIGAKAAKFMRGFKTQHEALLESQRNQLKKSIVDTYGLAKKQGFIQPMELETVNREFDSYKALGGNHYAHSLIKRLNEEVPVIGEPIPTDQ